MKSMFSKGMFGTLLVAAMLAMTVLPAFAQKTTPATDKSSNVPAVPRAIPDLVNYTIWDPPKHPGFSLNNLTVSGDIRVRPEFRSHRTFNATVGPGFTQANKPDNQFFTQQWIRLGFNYEISPDVTFFVQPQVSNNFGAESPGSSGTTFFLRQGFMLIRNLGVPNLSLKAGRQLVVWGNHRMFGHFDWNNIGWMFDGVTTRYNHPTTPVEFGWLRVGESDIGLNAGGANTPVGGGHNDDDIVFIRVPAKLMGWAVEPVWIWESGGTGTTVIGGQQGNQQRHTWGARIAGKIIPAIDTTIEGYHQFGTLGATNQARNLHINAFAFHMDAGYTMFQAPMQPRLGLEFNYGSGDGDNNSANCNNTTTTGCGGNQNTFSQLFPTNHIHFGYMDLMSWQNMVTYSGNIQVRPTKASHLEAGFHIMRLANRRDNWYGANQAVFLQSSATNQAASLGQELDIVYTLFFQNNKVGWQVGWGHFFAGEFVKRNSTGSTDQDWGYTQLWINF